MWGYCAICKDRRPEVEWNEQAYQFECPTHSGDLTTPRLSAPKTEVIDSRASQTEDEPQSGADWSSVDELCGQLSGLLDVNDPRYEVENWRQAQARLRAQDKRRLVHTPTCNVTLALNNPGWMGGRNCDCKAEWK